jgi:hypothetical protein
MPSSWIAMSSLVEVVAQLQNAESPLLLTQSITFITVCTGIKKHILAVYDSQHIPEVTPDILPQEPCLLAAKICNISENDSQLLWSVLKQAIWTPEKNMKIIESEKSLDGAFQSAKQSPFCMSFA